MVQLLLLLGGHRWVLVRGEAEPLNMSKQWTVSPHVLFAR